MDLTDLQETQINNKTKDSCSKITICRKKSLLLHQKKSQTVAFICEIVPFSILKPLEKIYDRLWNKI